MTATSKKAVPHRWPVRTHEWGKRVRRAKLGRGTKAVLFVLLSHMQPSGTGAKVSQATLAEEAEVSRSTVERAVRVGKECGLIHVVRYGSNRTGDANRYALALPYAWAGGKGSGGNERGGGDE